MNRTPIEWTDFSANPLKFRTADGRVVWACEKLSPGCTNCYAEDLSHRYGGVRRAGDWNAGTMATLTPFLDEKELRHMLTAKVIDGKPVAGSKCFIGDMTDIFGLWVPDELLDRLFAVFDQRRDVTWQVLTKRANRLRQYLTETVTFHGRTYPAAQWRLLLDANRRDKTTRQIDDEPWPLKNVWLGVSAEDQKRADERIPLLLQAPAAVRFISAEPLLGPVDLTRFIGGSDTAVDDLAPEDAHCVRCGCWWDEDSTEHECPAGFGPRPDWVIVGGESGADARPCAEEWIARVVDQCRAAGVPVFVKQLGAYVVSEARTATPDHLSDPTSPKLLRAPNGECWAWRAGLRDRKGGDPSEWPEDLRVREFPEARR
jgi:protein gp37